MPAEKRSLLFSATVPKGIATLARSYQRDALRVEVERGRQGHVDIEYRAMRIYPQESEAAVVNLLRLVESPTAIVFCNTREAVRHLSATLTERGFSVVTLSGELSQHERNQAMQALRNGRSRVLVATDVAARGIDLPHVGIVIHADLPHDVETLQHRSGRTGRAGTKGVSAILTPFGRRRSAERLFAEAGIQPLWVGPPTRCGSARARRRALPRRSRAGRARQRGRSGNGAPAASPSAAPKRSRRRWCGSIARACRPSRR